MGDTHAGVLDELEGFVEDALDQRLVEEFEFGSHVVPTGLKPDQFSDAALEGPSFHGGPGAIQEPTRQPRR